MYLLRVQVPDFRVLKAVDITFEYHYMPRIFPLGSLNGGGKSTLLQLIFTLLHCAGDQTKHRFIQNLLQGYYPGVSEPYRSLASFTLREGDQCYELEFIVTPRDDHSGAIPVQFYPITDDPSTLDQGRLWARICDLDQTQLKDVLSRLSPRLFLAAPSTQIFLFSALESRQKLLKNAQRDYEDDFYKLEQDLKHFFPYRFLSVNLLITLFKLAQEKDFNRVMNTQSISHVQQLLTELGLILGKGMSVTPNEDLSGAIFQLQDNEEPIQLQPEDLSHGELKRLSIFMWLKYHQMENAIILMDEPEIAFHPDWQYQIVNDLLEWAPHNQYILATHSYEVCQALTPGHVKELETNPLPYACQPQS
jgi:predicted ATP-dependent endonuclease of OLD family